MVKSQQEYFWSSFGARTGVRENNLLKEGISNSELDMVRLITHRGGIIGNKDFIAKISGLTNRDIVIRPTGRPKKGI